MHEQGVARLAAAGYGQYEVSAYARPGRHCRHNLSYWTFGDYLGIGAGAHAKLTDPTTGQVERATKLRHPDAYLAVAPQGRFTSSRRTLDAPDLVMEFALFAFRLRDGFDRTLFKARTGLPFDQIAALAAAQDRGLLVVEAGAVRPTELGWRFLNDLIQHFGPNP